MIAMTWPQYLRGECTASGFRVRLTRLQTEVLATLLLRFPATVPIGDLIESTWPDDEPDNSMSSIYRIIRSLRVRLGGFHIAGRHSYGFRIVQRSDCHDN